MNMLDLNEIKKQKEAEKNPEAFEEQEPEVPAPPRIKRPRSKKLGVWSKAFIFAGMFLIAAGITFSNDTVQEKSGQILDKMPVVGQIKHLAESSDKKLQGEKEDRINILLLGMGGKDHEGAYLTDTIILASIKPSTKKVALMSIPRDLTVPIEGKGWQKINAINAYAEQEKEGTGARATAQTLEGILDIPIHYHVRADFQGFINIIDRLDGVNVEVEQTLDDYKYPVMGKEDAENYSERYQHLHIEEGEQHMDGELALKYVRSRHAQGEQGSDFARARRQQKVLNAVKERFKSTDMVLKPSLIMDIMQELDDHVSTNMEVWEMVKMWQMTKNIKMDQIKKHVLKSGPQGLLKSQTSTSTGFILLPKGGDFAEIQYKIKNIFSDNQEEKEEIKKVDDVALEVRNGTWINGLAGRASVDLKKHGFNITRIGNSSKKNFQKSVIYDLTFGEKMEALQLLKKETDANVSFDIPDWLKQNIKQDVQKTNTQKPDFILILGQNASTQN